jgi:hypothetical protein
VNTKAHYTDVKLPYFMISIKRYENCIEFAMGKFFTLKNSQKPCDSPCFGESQG